MRHCADKLAGRLARQLRVGIEGDDVFDFAQNRLVAHYRGEAFRAAPAEKGVELHQLSAFPFVAHPQVLARVPAAGPMEKKKGIAPPPGKPTVQKFDSRP